MVREEAGATVLAVNIKLPAILVLLSPSVVHMEG